MSRENVETLRRLFERWGQGITEVPTDLGSVQLEGRGSGLALDQEVGWLAGFSADGRVSHIRVFADHEAAREAAAASE